MLPTKLHPTLRLLAIASCGLVSACSTTSPFGPPDDPDKPIPPARPSPFEETVSGSNASPWSGNAIDSASQSSH
jgi:hypothetical protein